MDLTYFVLGALSPVLHVEGSRTRPFVDIFLHKVYFACQNSTFLNGKV
jgi:hypothetical protein